MAPSPVTWNVLSPGPSEEGQMDQIQRMLSPALIHFISLRYCVSLVYFPPPTETEEKKKDTDIMETVLLQTESLEEQQNSLDKWN